MNSSFCLLLYSIWSKYCFQKLHRLVLFFPTPFTAVILLTCNTIQFIFYCLYSILPLSFASINDFWNMGSINMVLVLKNRLLSPLAQMSGLCILSFLTLIFTWRVDYNIPFFSLLFLTWYILEIIPYQFMGHFFVLLYSCIVLHCVVVI